MYYIAHFSGSRFSWSGVYPRLQVSKIALDPVWAPNEADLEWHGHAIIHFHIEAMGMDFVVTIRTWRSILQLISLDQPWHISLGTSDQTLSSRIGSLQRYDFSYINVLLSPFVTGVKDLMIEIKFTIPSIISTKQHSVTALQFHCLPFGNISDYHDINQLFQRGFWGHVNKIGERGIDLSEDEICLWRNYKAKYSKSYIADVRCFFTFSRPADLFNKYFSGIFDRKMSNQTVNFKTF